MNDFMRLSPMGPVNVTLFGKVVFVDASVKDMRNSWLRVGLKSNKYLCKTSDAENTQRRGLLHFYK